MRAGDIVFVKGTSWISRIIRWIDEGEFTHVGIAFSETELIEAQRFTRVRIYPLGDVEHTVASLSVTERERSRMLIEAQNLLGTRYDYLQIIGYIVRKLFGRKGSGRFNSPNKLICSELVSRAVYAAGITNKKDELYDLTPNQLYDYLEYLGKERRSE